VSFELGLLCVVFIAEALELVDVKRFWAYLSPREQMVNNCCGCDYSDCLASYAEGMLTQLYLSERLPLPCAVSGIALCSVAVVLLIELLLILAAVVGAIPVQLTAWVLASEFTAY
jgi:hypothetical protein